MRGDFSRWTFDPDRLFSRVLMQQGRALLDADWNEQSAILLDFTRGLAADLIGPHGGPAGNLGFAVTPAPGNPPDLAIGGGRYYVDGVLCGHQMRVRLGERPVPALYSAQPFLPAPPALPAAPYLVYLDVWERHQSGLEADLDPHSSFAPVREAALGGADTCSRAQVVWQVRAMALDELPARGLVSALPAPAAVTCADIDGVLGELRQALRGPGGARLSARARQPEADPDPCVTPPENRYRGPENQLYRVEVHRGGREGEATFKWSRENGSVLARWLATEGDQITVTGVRDGLHGFGAGDWVELTDQGRELRGEPGVMARLAKVEGDRLSLAPGSASEPVPADPPAGAKVRRWDHRERGGLEIEGGAVVIAEGAGSDGWLELESGVEVQFQAGGVYRSGDFWLIPARTATGDVEWPGDPANPAALPPLGVEHHYAPLALVLPGGAVTDLRKRFRGQADC